VIFTLLIFCSIFVFAIRYRRRPRAPSDLPNVKQLHGSFALEIAWTVIPFALMLVMFVWGTQAYFHIYTPPKEALEIYVTGKQWMWKVQYPDGQREIDELHVPVGRPVKLILASEDVIHSFFVPAFRVKRDVVPGRYQTLWFEPTVPGRYHLFCAEYCGTNHSGMRGWVTVMEPADFEAWLAGSTRGGSIADQGSRLFQQLGCIGCHVMDAQGRCPTLRNVYGNPVRLADGRSVIADETYIRESILNPNAKIVHGYPKDVMPSFQGQVNEEGLLQLVVYIKSLYSPTASGPTQAKEGSK
jgi:cytochrome c oxidase subunit 2